MFSITVRSEKEDKRIPIAVASDVMFDVQLMLTHIGESFIAEEFGSYGLPAEALTERFTLYIDPESGGISFKTSAGKGHSALMDKAIAKFTATLDKMGSGSGTYWMEDNYNDPRYRCMVLYDLMQLSKHMAVKRGYALFFDADGKEKRFEPLDMDKTQAFLDKNGRIARNAVAGILNVARSKRNTPMYGFVVGDDRVKLSFRSPDAEGDAARYVNSAVVIKGVLKYSDEGELLEVSDIESVEPFSIKVFRNMISADRDIPLAVSVEANVSYDGGTMLWKLAYPDLGISSSDQDWDVAVTAFHDYFVFLCDNDQSKDGNELSDEEKEVKELLDSLTGAAE
jgi:hypothetical protein